MDAGARSAIAGLRCRIGRRASSAPTSASRISKSASPRSTSTRFSDEEAIDGAAALEDSGRSPGATRSSQYTKQILWIRKDNYVTVRIDSYVKDEVVRRLQSSKIRRSRESGPRTKWS